MQDLFLTRRAIVLQHVLDQVDAPARRIEFVAEGYEGWAGGGAHAAMDAAAQNVVRNSNFRFGQLFWRKIRLHFRLPAISRG